MTTTDDPKDALPSSDIDAKTDTADARVVKPSSVESRPADTLPGEAISSEANSDTSASNKKNSAERKAKEKPQAKRANVVLILVVLLLLLLLTGIAIAGYLGWQKYTVLTQQIKTDEHALTQQNQRLNELASKINTLQSTYSSDKAGADQEFQGIQQRLKSQNKRLLSLSTTSREDWLLAEAEYLLKLANQRVLIEREGSAADGLLTEADHILRDLDDPDLNPIRQAIARDIAALRLMQRVDTEGVYFSLVALLEQVASIPFIPTRQQRIRLSETSANAESAIDSGDINSVTETPLPWRERLRASFKSFTGQLNNYIRITKDDTSPIKIIAPQERDYVEQNTRMMILRAQIALLQQKTTIYQQSLAQAQSWITEFYPTSTQASAFINELDTLSKLDIEQSAPDITASLELLRSYIERLHKLQGSGANAMPVEGDK